MNGVIAGQKSKNDPRFASRRSGAFIPASEDTATET
jgi:hypothetical protein